MNNERQCIEILTGKIFKLLPMKERFDQGEDNHLYDYLESVILRIDGLMNVFPEIAADQDINNIYISLSSLKNNRDVSVKKWRSIILRCTRLASSAKEKYQED